MKQIWLALLVSTALIGTTACSETAPTSAEPTFPAVPTAELPKGSDSPSIRDKPMGTTSLPTSTTTTPLETPSTTPDEDHKIDNFATKISFPEPRVISVDEEFTVEATLTNGSEQDLRIMHAGKLFYFVIEDSTGKGANTFTMHEVGINRPFQGKGTITEPYTYKLSKPGVYEISARAEFSIMDGEKSQRRVEIVSESISFEVK